MAASGLPLVQFEPNTPVELALKYAEGRQVNGRFGKPSVMFTTADDRVMFLEPDVAARIHALGVTPGQPLRIVKTEAPGRKPDWLIEKFAGEQKDGTFVVPRSGAAPFPESTAPVHQVPATSNTVHPNTQAAALQRACAPAARDTRTVLMAGLLREDTNMLVDVMGSCIEHAKKYSGAISNDDVRALAITVYIQHTKGARA